MTASTFFSNSLILELDCASCVTFLLCCSIQSHSPVCNNSRRGVKAYHVVSLPTIEVHLLARRILNPKHSSEALGTAGLCVRRQTDPRIIRHANDDLLNVTAGTQNKQTKAPRWLRESGLSSAQPRVLIEELYRIRFLPRANEDHRTNSASMTSFSMRLALTSARNERLAEGSKRRWFCLSESYCFRTTLNERGTHAADGGRSGQETPDWRERPHRYSAQAPTRIYWSQ